MKLLKDASRDHIPLDPTSSGSKDKTKNILVIPESTERATIKDVIEEIGQQIWYKNQIIHRETFAAKDAQIGDWCEHLRPDITR